MLPLHQTIYIYIIECEMISIVESWDGGGGSIIYLILRDWKRRWNICGDQIKWSKDTFYISTYMIFPWQKYIPLFLRVYGNIPSIIVNIIRVFFFIFKTKRRGTNGDNRSNCQDGTFVSRLNRKANVTENQVIR